MVGVMVGPTMTPTMGLRAMATGHPAWRKPYCRRPL